MSRTPLRTLTAIVSAALLGFTAACGGGDDDVVEPQSVVEGGDLGQDSEGEGDDTDTSVSADPSGITDAGPGSDGADEDATETPDDSSGEAAEELAGLEIREKAPMDGYERDDYGEPWSDAAEGVELAGNGCDTRNDILDRDMTEVEKSDDCQVESGKLYNPYGTEDEPHEHYIDFQRGTQTSGAVQIDHIVALGNVHASGGEKLDEAQKLAIANDPINLLAVDGPENGAKGDRDASEWLPANDKVHCFYAASQIRVKAEYGLSVTQEEHDVLADLITRCSV